MCTYFGALVFQWKNEKKITIPENDDSLFLFVILVVNF